MMSVHRTKVRLFATTCARYQHGDKFDCCLQSLWHKGGMDATFVHKFTNNHSQKCYQVTNIPQPTLTRIHPEAATPTQQSSINPA